ncbi:MAG: hypothetical protein ACRDKW_09425 [Actinomycetota bacterium]
MKDRLAKFCAGALFVAAAFQAGSLAWQTLNPGDPGCAIYEDTAGKTDRVALSGGEAVDAMFQILDTTRDPEVTAGIRGILDATAAGDAAWASAAQARVMRACGLDGAVRGYGNFEGQLTDRLG